MARKLRAKMVKWDAENAVSANDNNQSIQNIKENLKQRETDI